MTHNGALVNARLAAILIALCLLVGIVGFSSVLSGAIDISGGENVTPGITTPTPDDTLTGGVAGTTGNAPAQTTPDESTTSALTPTVAPTEYIEQDSTLLPDGPTRSPSLPPTTPATIHPTSLSSPVTETSTPAPTQARTDPSEPVTPSGPAPISVRISAEDEKYSPSSITVPTGSKVTIVFENQDVDVPHNVIIYADKTAPIFIGTIVKGPGRTTDTFTAPSTPGTYTLGCSIPSPHGKGTFIVE